MKREHKVSGILPSGYTELAYIEGNGTQYFDTGVNFNASTDSIDVDFVATQFREGELFGGGYYATTNGEIYCGFPNNSFFGVVSIINSNNTISCQSYSLSTMVEHNVKIENMIPYLDGVASTRIKNVNPDFSIYMFALNRNGGIIVPGYFRISSYIHNRNGNAIRNYVPALRDSDSKPGMYDIVNDVFYVNQGDGEFSYGTLD